MDYLINDIDVDQHIEMIASLFADDTAICMKDLRIKGSSHILMQEEIDNFMAWTKSCKMKFNEETRLVISSSASETS